jgi:hypothetical protein
VVVLASGNGGFDFLVVVQTGVQTAEWQNSKPKSNAKHSSPRFYDTQFVGHSVLSCLCQCLLVPRAQPKASTNPDRVTSLLTLLLNHNVAKFSAMVFAL